MRLTGFAVPCIWEDMHTSTRIGFALFGGLVLGAVIGRIVFETASLGAIAGGIVGVGLAWALERGDD